MFMSIHSANACRAVNLCFSEWFIFKKRIWGMLVHCNHCLTLKVLQETKLCNMFYKHTQLWYNHVSCFSWDQNAVNGSKKIVHPKWDFTPDLMWHGATFHCTKVNLWITATSRRWMISGCPASRALINTYTQVSISIPVLNHDLKHYY